MSLDVSSLPENTADLKTLLISLAASHADLQEKEQSYQWRIEYLEERIRLLQNELFGRKTEKLPKEDRSQLFLFNEVESEKEVQDKSLPDEIIIAQHSRKKRGRKPLPEDLPRIEVIHDLAESEKVCDCGIHLSRIGEQVCHDGHKVFRRGQL